jgi:hypothetical protein
VRSGEPILLEVVAMRAEPRDKIAAGVAEAVGDRPFAPPDLAYVCA